MTLFETVKNSVTVKQAAEHYGCKVNRGDMICCPFHDDRHPSMKLNRDYFYCFGCGATGDVIDFVARLFGLSSYEAAKKLAYDFGIDPDKPPAAMALKKPYPLARAFRNDEMYCQRVLCDYLHLLERWKVEYAPQSPEDELDDRFVEACHMIEYVDHLLDVLMYAELEQRVKAVDMLLKDGTITALEQRLKRLEKEVQPPWRRTSNRVRSTSPSGLTARVSTKPCFVMIFSADTKSSTQTGLFSRPMAA